MHEKRFSDQQARGLEVGSWYRLYHGAMSEAPSVRPSTVVLVLRRRLMGVEVFTEAGVIQTIRGWHIDGYDYLPIQKGTIDYG